MLLGHFTCHIRMLCFVMTKKLKRRMLEPSLAGISQKGTFVSNSFTFFLIVSDKLSEAEELAQLSVREAESLKNRIMGLEERLEFSQTTSTPLILPPPASRSGGSNSRSLLQQERTSSESITPPASLDAADHTTNSLVNDTAISTSRTAVQDVAGESATCNADRTTLTTKEAELTVLKESIQKLQEKLVQSQQECSALQEREHTLQQKLGKETQSEVKGVSCVDGKYHKLQLWLPDPLDYNISQKVGLQHILYLGGILQSPAKKYL